FLLILALPDARSAWRRMRTTASYLRIFVADAVGPWLTVRLSLKSYHPVLSQFQRQHPQKGVDETGAIPIDEVDERQRALLRVPEREDLRLSAHELAAQRFVTAFCCLNDFAMERLQVVLHLAHCRLCRSRQGWIQHRHGVDDALQRRAQRTVRALEGIFYFRRKLGLEKLIEGGFIARPQCIECHLLLVQESGGA